MCKCECKQAEIARKYFQQGFNCAQSTAAAFGPATGLESDLLLRMGTAFGGGIADRKATCGAVTGMLMAAGLLFGADKAMAPEVKAAMAGRMNSLIESFEANHGSAICQDLLAKMPEGTEKRDYCGELVYNAACLLAQEIGL